MGSDPGCTVVAPAGRRSEASSALDDVSQNTDPAAIAAERATAFRIGGCRRELGTSSIGVLRPGEVRHSAYAGFDPYARDVDTLGGVKLTVLGGSGAFPVPDMGCSGYLVEEAGFRLLIDPGYGIAGELMRLLPATELDAVYVTHRHPDHCADLNPLLRARAMADEPAATPLPIYAPPDALQVVLALDRPGMLDEAYELHEFGIGDAWELGPLRLETRELPHYVPNAAVRLSGSAGSIVYTGDGGPSPALVELAEGADLLVAEATHIDEPSPEVAGLLSDAGAVGRQAATARVGELMLTHLWPGDDPELAIQRAGQTYGGPICVARPGVTVEVDGAV
jgi:ribonuclease BN (tRNA processing enzyme)